jgi:hypothetical protein
MPTPQEPANGPEGRTGTDWDAIDWRTADRNVRNVRHRIFKGDLLEPYEVKVSRPVVRPGKADVSSRSQSCRGKNRKPRSWRAGRRETKGLKPLDNLIWSGGSEFSGRNDSEREVAP